MKNISLKTQQNAIVKRTLNLEEFVKNYLVPVGSTNDSDLKPITIAAK
ncbi:hypothetical protein ACFSKN_03770 [Mariniflexile gromovii]|uniref:Uncharacterized protein n=1 Tax=Mariniflexile gromovii TaxID=362523 RepID=A0ABS4BT00_9FLAO|nr:hypothetical protein [Mariniflexile gromovii]MBP0903682.1 hypothetical protein [Mariniflexile gromovii]